MMPEVSKEMIAAAALLHDVGKFMRRSGREGSHHYNSYVFIAQKLRKARFFTLEEVNMIALLALHHHRYDKEPFLPGGKENPYLRIIMQADCDSASERNLDGADKGSIETAPLSHILSAVDCALGEKDANKVLVFPPQEFYPLLSPISPAGYGGGTERAAEVYARFEDDFEKLVEKSASREDFILRLPFLLKRYASAVTSSGKEQIRDISLYSHLYTTAALAICRYIDRENGRDVFRDYSYKILYGRIFDIQEYIYGNLNKNVEKPLRRILTRSMLVSLANQIIPYQIVSKLGLYPFNIMFSGGGSFLILLPASLAGEAEKESKVIKEKIACFFENKIFLETVLADLGIREEGEYRLDEYFRSAFESINSRKYLRTADYIGFDREGDYCRCANCGINTKEEVLCRACQLENLWMAVDMEKLILPYEMMDVENIFCPEKFADSGGPGVAFSLNHLGKENLMDIKVTGRTAIRKHPEFCAACREQEGCTIEKGEEISLNCLAYTSLYDDVLATARMDVDDLGFLLYETYPLSIGGETYPFALSRLAFMSQLTDTFFSTGIKKMLEDRFGNEVVLLYSGGDDLIMSGRWDSVLKAALEIKKGFGNFVASRDEEAELTLSAGLVFHASQKPFNQVLREAEKNIEKAKQAKNCVNINGINYTWGQLKEAEEESEKLAGFIREKKIARRTIFSMLRLLDIKGRGEEIRRARRAALFYYYAERNLKPGDSLRPEEAEEIRRLLENLVARKKEDEFSYSRLVLELADRKTRERRD